MEEFLDNEQKKDAAKQNRNRDGGGEYDPSFIPNIRDIFTKNIRRTRSIG